jgi:hypothetical protein
MVDWGGIVQIRRRNAKVDGLDGYIILMSIRVSIEHRQTTKDAYEKAGGTYPICVVLDTLPCRLVACCTWQITT